MRDEEDMGARGGYTRGSRERPPRDEPTTLRAEIFASKRLVDSVIDGATEKVVGEIKKMRGSRHERLRLPCDKVVSKEKLPRPWR